MQWSLEVVPRERVEFHSLARLDVSAKLGVIAIISEIAPETVVPIPARLHMHVQQVFHLRDRRSGWSQALNT